MEERGIVLGPVGRFHVSLLYDGSWWNSLQHSVRLNKDLSSAVPVVWRLQHQLLLPRFVPKSAGKQGDSFKQLLLNPSTQLSLNIHRSTHNESLMIYYLIFHFSHWTNLNCWQIRSEQTNVRPSKNAHRCQYSSLLWIQFTFALKQSSPPNR